MDKKRKQVKQTKQEKREKVKKAKNEMDKGGERGEGGTPAQRGVYGDGAGNTSKENSTIISLIRMH